MLILERQFTKIVLKEKEISPILIYIIHYTTLPKLYFNILILLILKFIYLS